MATEQSIPPPLSARAEKFFARGNYFEAKKEWESLLSALSSDAQQAVKEKILACEAELGKAKTQTLVSKARKLARADELAKALACFEEAAALRADDSTREEAARLRSELLRRRAPGEASAFEAAGDYASAVEVYGRLIASVESARLRRPPDPLFLRLCPGQDRGFLRLLDDVEPHPVFGRELPGAAPRRAGLLRQRLH